MSKNQLFKLFGMNKSSYYYGLQPKPINIEMVKLKALIRQIFNDSKQSAGARSIAAILMNEHGCSGIIKLDSGLIVRLRQDQLRQLISRFIL